MTGNRRAKGDGTLFKRSDGVWIGAFTLKTVDGKQRRKTVSSRDRNECLRKMRELRTKIDAGQVATTSSATVSKWLDHWLETIVATKSRPRTYDSYEQAIRLHIKPHIGTKRLDRLTAEDIRGMHAKISSDRFAQLSHQVLSSALKVAMLEGKIPRNPAELAGKPKYTPVGREPFPADVAKKVLATAFASRDESTSTRWAAAFLTGARPAELLGLEWDRVDLAGGYIDLAWQMQRLKAVHGCGDTCGKTRPGYCPNVQWKFPRGFEARQCHKTLWWTRPKTKTGTRIVPLLPPLVVALDALKAADGINPHGLVWHQPDGRPISPEEDQEAWQNLLKAAKVGAAPRYTTRDTAATLLLEAGVDEQTRMAILGHSSVAAHRGYVHVNRDRTRAALANLGMLMPPP